MRLLQALLLASASSMCAGEFQILQEVGPTATPAAASPAPVAADADDAASDAPSDVPSTSPSPPSQQGAGGPPTAVPTIAFTDQPTTIPICPQEWTQYRTCFQSEMPSEEADACDMCVGASMPGPGATCEQHSASICDALTASCDCAPCHDDIELYFRCTYAELGLDCPLDCGTVAAPSDAPSSSPTAGAPKASTPTPATGAPSSSAAAADPAGSTSGAVATRWGNRPSELEAFVVGAVAAAAFSWP